MRLSQSITKIALLAYVLVGTSMPVLAQTTPVPTRSIAPAASASDTSQAAYQVATAPVKIKPLRDPELYKTEVTLTSQSDSERQGATARALLQVVVKLTGNLQAPSNPVIRRALSSASSLVSDESTPVTASDSEGNTSVGSVPVYKTSLQVSFDPSAVDALIAGSGLKYWTGVRPRPILWLAIDDGRGARLVTGQQLNVVRPLALRGLERGIRFLLPAGSAIEQAAVNSIWAQNAAAMQVLTARYNNDAQLIGKVYRSAGGWAADWLLSQAGVELARWSVSDADARRVIASGADTTADTIAQRDAVYLPSEPAGVFTIDIVVVDSQDDFLRLMGYLQNLAIVRKVIVIEANADHLRLQLDLSTGLRGFRNLVATGNTMRLLSDLDQAPATDPALSNARVPRFGLQR